MNTTAVITAGCFTAFAAIILVYLFFTKNPLLSGKLRNYFRAGTAVYLSGTLLILILSFALKGVPTAFIVISELMIMTVFIVTYILIVNLSKTIAAVTLKNAQKPEQKETSDE
jgi:amino acid permease